MNNIGYAVFGTPKGLKVDSNGLFKKLNLDKSLYFNNDHLALEKGDLLLMIRRVPSNLNNLLKKDALLIALYENALQHGENRAGGFVGSAICFKAHMPNAEEIVSGLMFLFSKIKENVDADNRFKSADSSDWNINLPDANKKFGLESGRLNYAPMSSNTTNVVVKLNSLKNEAASLLYNFALNGAFHSTEYVYAATSKSVVDRIKSKNFVQVSISEFFNYNKQLASYKERQTRETEKLNVLKNEVVEVENKKSFNIKELKSLENKITTNSDHFNDLERKINDSEIKFKKLNQEVKQLTSKVRPTINKQDNRPTANLEKKYASFKRTIDSAAKKIQKQSSFEFSKTSNNIDDFNKTIIDDYFRELPKRKSNIKKLVLGLFATILFLLLAILYLLFFPPDTEQNLNNSEITEQVLEIEKKSETEALKKENSKKRLTNLELYKKDAEDPNPLKFKELANSLLKDNLDGIANDKEKEFIETYDWEFYEFDFNESNIKSIKSLNEESVNNFFIIFKVNQIREKRSDYLVWKGESEIDKVLGKYKKENPNDLYQNLNQKIIDDTQLMLKHFKWMIEKENGDIEDLEIGQQINLPFTEKNKIQ